MGRQFQVYLLPSDAVKLVDVLRQKVGTLLLAPRSNSPEPVELKSPLVSQCGFTNADCLLVHDLSVELVTDHVPKQRYWTIDTMFSEVIEFDACCFDEKTIKRGRLFYD